MTVQAQKMINSRTVSAHRVDGGWLVVASPNHLDEDWQSVITQLDVADRIIDQNDFMSTRSGRFIWYVSDAHG